MTITLQYYTEIIFKSFFFLKNLHFSSSKYPPRFFFYLSFILVHFNIHISYVSIFSYKLSPYSQ
jgi:hypothetical protein